LISEGVDPSAIVAFTFTEKAAAELKDRIIKRVAEAMGDGFKGRLAQMFVGTIHSYCFKLLQDHVPKYGNFDVLEPHRHAGLLSRAARDLNIASLGRDGHWAPLLKFSETVDVIGNELITPRDLAGTPLGDVYASYLETLDRYHFLTFGLIIQKTVEALEDAAIFKKVHTPLRHLIVDEYQDINPAQEALIRKLGSGHVQVCVVGDDDQSIYQWRGSQTRNILTFKSRYKAKAITLATNRRSRKEIVELSARFAATIPERIAKTMEASRESDPASIVPWSAETPEDEAKCVADAILAMHKRGVRYQDIAILFRSARTSAVPFIEAFRERGIPINCAARTGLFLLPEIDAFARTYIWFVDNEWRPPGYGQTAVAVTKEDLARDYLAAFGKVQPVKKVIEYLEHWKKFTKDSETPANLVGDFYTLLNFMKVHELDANVPDHSARLGSFARFSNILADFENVNRRARWVDEDDGTSQFRGGQSYGIWFYRKLANFIQNYAADAYEEFEGEPRPDLEAVDISTIHQAKGLEWQVVFMPALVDRRFPSINAGKDREWLLPLSALPQESRERYQGGDDEERRLFYVAMTRARDTLYLSHFNRIKNKAKPSPYLIDLFQGPLPARERLPIPAAAAGAKKDESPRVSVSFSELADFDECGFRYRLANSLGFETQLVSELGYGRAIHHVLRYIAEMARSTGKVPTLKQVEQVLADEFYLPFANRNNFDNMKRTADRMVAKYLTEHRDDLMRIWATERPFEMHLDVGTLSGRADVILTHHNGKPDSLAIVDYKTAKGSDQDAVFAFQLAVYAAAGRGEGLSIDAAYLHDLDHAKRNDVDVGHATTTKAVERVVKMMTDLGRSKFDAKPEKDKCGACEYRKLCKHATVDSWEAE
jgi:DNA helicase-2/ATP-dependent DNA helicase PcrA